MNSIETEELGGPFGVRIQFDLQHDANDDERATLRELLAAHHLLVLRSPGLSQQDQVRFAAYFGPPLPIGDDDAREQYVSNTRPDGVLGTAKLCWHSDTSFAPVPYRVLGLYGLEVEPGRTSTRFACASTAYRALPADLEALLSNRQVVNVTEVPGVDHDTEGRGKRLITHGTSTPSAGHPVLMQHPFDGSRFLYVNEMHSDFILGMPPEQSEEVLGALFALLYAPTNVYEHWWQEGDYVVWDNLTVQHSRGDVSEVGPRTLRKVTIGTVRLREQFPQFFETIPYRNATSRLLATPHWETTASGTPGSS